MSLSLLYANGVVPGGMVKALIYPGAVAKAIYKNNAIPSYGKLLEAYKFTNMKESYITHDLQNLEVNYQFIILLEFGGSSFSVLVFNFIIFLVLGDTGYSRKLLVGGRSTIGSNEIRET